MKKPSISVVVPAHNCENTIFQTLQSILKQTVSDIDVIVVDDGSTDQTVQIIKSISGVRYYYQDNAGPAAARNLGVQKAKGDIVFFTDSDCMPQRDWIEKAIVHFNDPQVVVVAGSYSIANPNNMLAQCIHDEIMFRHHRLMPQNPKSFGSYNFGVKKNVFESVGGFDICYRYASGEDNDLSYKILKAGYKIRFEKNALVDHFHTTRIFKYFKEQYRHGFWRAKMYVDHPGMAKGDDYTFWKDIVEVLLVFFILFGSVFLFIFPSSFVCIVLLALAILLVLEVYFSFVSITDSFGKVFFSFVMFFRAFARALGLSSGIPRFLVLKNFKKVK